MSILKCSAVLGLVLLMLPFTVSADPDTTSFKVTSYIPVLFRDMQWTINGRVERYGTGDHNYNAPGDDQYSATYSSRSRYIGAGTDWRKIYVTRSLAWNLGLSASSAYSREDYISGNDVHTAYRLSHAYDSTSTSTGSFSLRLLGSVNPYLSGDFFLSVSGDLSANFSKTYNSDGVGEGHYIDSVVTDRVYTEDRWYIRHGNSSSETYSYTASVGAGWGRVYFGNYAATALYMIEELKNHGQLKSLPDRSQMDSLTEMIYQYRMKHAIDSRLRRIEVLGAVAAFLRAHGLADMADPVAGLYLQDVWDYFPTDQRKFGFIVQASAGVRDYRSWYGSGQRRTYFDSYIVRAANTDSIIDSVTYNDAYSSESHYSSRSNSPVFTGSVSYFRPLSLRTQLNATATGNYYLDPTNKGGYSTYTTEHYYDAACDITLDYIFSSRTRSRIGASAQYTTYESVEYYDTGTFDDYNRERTDLGRFTLSGTLQYRIAIPTTLLGTLRYNTYRRNQRDDYDPRAPRATGHDYTLSLSISHALY
jgi:hypothetical protein